MSVRGLVPHLAAALVVAGCAWLTAWQIERAGEKRELLARWHAAEPVRLAVLAAPYELPQPVTGVGTWERRRQILLDNRVRGHRHGVEVLTPFRLADGRLFLVDRGWAPWPARDAELPDPDVAGSATAPGTPDAPTATAAVTIEGVLAEPPGVGVRMGPSDAAPGEAWPRLVTYFDHERLAEWLGEELQPAVVRLAPEHPAHLTGDEWQVATFGPKRHIGYALTWTSIGLVVAGIWITLSWRHRNRRRAASRE